MAGIPAPPLKGSPYQVVGGGWVQCVENQGVVPCPPPNSYSIGVESSPYGSVSISSSIGQPIVKTKKENPVGENGYASSYTSSVTQTRAGYVGQVRVEVDGENVIVWESAPFNEAKTAKSRQKAAAAAKVALRKGVDAVFASVTVTDDEVTALLPVEKSAA